MTYKLFLDDERVPEQVTWKRLPLGPWVVVRNYDEFRQTIAVRGTPEFVSYDHDLADVYHDEIFGSIERDGLTCAGFLIQQHCLELDIPHPSFEVHSMNPIGATRIRNYIEDYNRVWHQDHTHQ